MTVRQKNGSETDEYFTTTTVNWGWGESRSRSTSPSRVAFPPGNARNNVVGFRLHKNLYVKAWKDEMEEL